ncbi:ankyrin repeat-containing domain protein [Chytriomyces sp. MP71]|nr:ankyrin repeat-containing domain protein [Chytriomyces sp. MP71]
MQRVPPEVLQSILLLLPINGKLLELALASKRLSSVLLDSLAFPRLHFKTQFFSSRLPIWNFLDSSNIHGAGWSRLPTSYKAAIFEYILAADCDLENVLDEAADPTEVAFDVALIDPERWLSSGPMLYKIYQWIEREPSEFRMELHGSCLFRWTCYLGSIDLARCLLQSPHVDPTSRNETAFGSAAYRGHIEIVRLLLHDGRCDPASDDNYAIRFASSRGHADIVELLLSYTPPVPAFKGSIGLLVDTPRIDAGAGNNFAIRLAVLGNHVHVVHVLLSCPDVDPAVEENYCVKLAAEEGFAEILRVLVADPRVDAAASGNHAIRTAAWMGFAECVEVLLSCQTVDPAGALVLAAEQGHVEVCRALLSSSHRWTLEEKRLAFLQASSNGHDTIIKLIQELECNETSIPLWNTSLVLKS